MRKDRLTLKVAQRNWDAIRAAIVFNIRGQKIALPQIDMAAIFGGRKSVTCKEVENEISKILDEYL